MKSIDCYCCSGKTFDNCCRPILNGEGKASSAEQLMRSRYSAFATQKSDYLIETTHFSTRKNHSEEDLLDWSRTNKWIKLEVINATATTIEFKAFYEDELKTALIHHEFSIFKEEDKIWYYVDGRFM
ncbi:YchJ family protein [Flavobacterium algicola]|uniref:YchJ family protein n=1 Tax=Flavobacterium algicola TaxID=556529 RepID=UPI001EFEB1A8|nr:YchJ family metal-binding protein [Flavobacterium algicola]MCG9793592.1 hypothetical protein [Flavobacterium algicola]